VSTPLLYLPDAISLILLLVVLSLLRSLAVMHIRQELAALRNEALLYWAGAGQSLGHEAYMGLCRRIRSRIQMSECLSPAFVFWLGRPSKSVASNVDRKLEGNYREQLQRELEAIAGIAARSKMRRFNLEADVSYGTFYLTGSISGWMLLAPVLFRMLVRASRYRSGNRVDRIFDMAERVLSRAGRRAYLLARTAG